MSTKTLKTSQDAKAGVQVGKNYAQVAVGVGDSDVNGIYVDESGVYIRGDVSMMTTPENIRVGGFWVQQTAWRQMLPSSIAFPNPNLKMKPSMSNFESMVGAVAWAMAFLV